MANIDQVITQIRFQLEQLSARNAHHEFEHLCRHLTRARICSNVLPATGPVSGGGDQGRDFETFRTYLSSSPIAESTFIGLISSAPIAFPCTLQKERIEHKIKSDVTTIMGSGTPVEAVHCFCTTEVPIALRHNLKEWAENTYSVYLEIYDGQAISELLANRDVFWIAETYLRIPSEIFPRVPAEQEESWYEELLTYWRQENVQPRNYADFSDIRVAARQAFSSHFLLQDVPFWIHLLKKFTSPEFSSSLRRRAMYETIVVTLRGLGTLEGLEDLIRAYFSEILHLDNPTDLQDAASLINYCVAVASTNKLHITLDEVSVWRRSLIERVDQKLNTENAINAKCQLLDIRGYLGISLDPQALERPTVNDALNWWGELVELVQDAPLFPLERFADLLTDYIKVLDITPDYLQLTQEVDALLAERAGMFVAADKCRNRAMILYKKGQIVEAIKLLHKAKIDWFAAETLEGSLLSMLFISQCYRELGLASAAKYYAMAVASLSLNVEEPDVKSYTSRALFLAAEYSYLQGFWSEFLTLVDMSFKGSILKVV
jgi:hypothetical protein